MSEAKYPKIGDDVDSQVYYLSQLLTACCLDEHKVAWPQVLVTAGAKVVQLAGRLETHSSQEEGIALLVGIGCLRH